MVVYAGLCGDITYAYGVFLPVMSNTFGWGRSALSGPYSLFFLVGGLLGPVAGAAVARWGGRKAIVLSGLAAAIGLLGMAGIRSLWQAYFFFGVLCGLAIAFGEFIPITSVINHWFIRKRSLAMGLLFTAGGIGGFFLPPLISLCIDRWGWRPTWAFLALLHFFLTVVLGGWLIRNRPEDLGEKPDGLPSPARPLSGRDTGPLPRVHQTMEDWTVREALGTPVLWMITLIFAVILFASAVLTTHQVAYLQDLRFSPFLSASALGLMIGSSIIGRLACGLLGLKVEARPLAAFFLSLMGIGILSLLSARQVGFVYGYSVLTGIGFGGMIVLMPNWISAYFGREHYPRIIGWTSPLVTVISAGGPLLAGKLYETTGNYKAPLILSAVMIFLCILLAFFSRRPKRPKKDTES
jgi:MFS family permease